VAGFSFLGCGIKVTRDEPLRQALS
jgi:hypothetical protein